VKPATLLIKGLLDRLPLLEGVNPEAVRELAAQSTLVRVARGQVIVRREERLASVYAVASGSVKTRLLLPPGDETVLSLLGSGATFGQTPVLLGKPSAFEVVALSETVLVAIRAACVVALVERNLRFSCNVARALAEKNHSLIAEVATGRLPSAQRLAQYLASLIEPAAASGGASTVRLPFSKTLLAARLGVKKETLSRLLGRLARDGVVRVAGRDITVLDRAGLEARTQAR
jgi:CRP/FNR family transcriptional regulator, dissimilatory nitrate respiration regulator